MRLHSRLRARADSCPLASGREAPGSLGYMKALLAAALQVGTALSELHARQICHMDVKVGAPAPPGALHHHAAHHP